MKKWFKNLFNKKNFKCPNCGWHKRRIKNNITDNFSYNTKMNFLIALDGQDNIKPIDPSINSYKIGLCKLDYFDSKLHVYLRRPGLLIGKYGKTIELFKKELQIDIYLYESDLLRD